MYMYFKGDWKFCQPTDGKDFLCTCISTYSYKALGLGSTNVIYIIVIIIKYMYRYYNFCNTFTCYL